MYKLYQVVENRMQQCPQLGQYFSWSSTIFNNQITRLRVIVDGGGGGGGGA